MFLVDCPNCQKKTLVEVVRTITIKQKWELGYGKPCYFCTSMAFCKKCGKYLGWK